MRYLQFAILTLFFGAFIDPASAQIIPPANSQDDQGTQEQYLPVGVDYSLLPLIGYSTDWGLYGGALLQRINYGEGVKPFLSNMQADFTISTRGNLITEFTYERTQTFGTPWRTYLEFVGQRFLQSHYFGIGNRTSFSNDLFDDDYYFFEMRELFLDVRGRREIARFGSIGFADIQFSYNLSYVDGIGRSEETLFEQEMPFGFGRSWTSKPGLGLIVDSRDSEFIPKRGIRYEFLYQLGSEVFGGDYNYSDLLFDFRHFVELVPNLVLAHNLRVESIFGEAPFWDLKMLGGETGLRGYYLERFRGDHSLLNMVELRTWLFSVWNENIRVGGQLFWDSGRVFSDMDSDAIFDNWQHAVGGGGVVSLFNPDLILRADLGYSDETIGIYFGAGYIF